MAWCARNYVWHGGGQTYQTIQFFAHTWLTWDDSKEATLTLSNSRRQLASNAHELEEVTSSIQAYAS